MKRRKCLAAHRAPRPRARPSRPRRRYGRFIPGIWSARLLGKLLPFCPLDRRKAKRLARRLGYMPASGGVIRELPPAPVRELGTLVTIPRAVPWDSTYLGALLATSRTSRGSTGQAAVGTTDTSPALPRGTITIQTETSR